MVCQIFRYIFQKKNLIEHLNQIPHRHVHQIPESCYFSSPVSLFHPRECKHVASPISHQQSVTAQLMFHRCIYLLMECLCWWSASKPILKLSVPEHVSLISVLILPGLARCAHSARLSRPLAPTSTCHRTHNVRVCFKGSGRHFNPRACQGNNVSPAHLPGV